MIRPADFVLGLLASGVPLTLLVDLADADGPDSRAIYREEAVADDIRRELSGRAAARAARDPSGSSTSASA